MLLVDDLAAGGTKNLRHTPRGLVTLCICLCLSEHLPLAYIYLMPKRTRIAHLDEIGHDMLFSTMEAFLAVRSDCI